jgi:hypothetical protein
VRLTVATEAAVPSPNDQLRTGLLSSGLVTAALNCTVNGTGPEVGVAVQVTARGPEELEGDSSSSSPHPHIESASATVKKPAFDISTSQERVEA